MHVGDVGENADHESLLNSRQSLIIHLNARFFLHPLGLLRWFTHEVFAAHLVPLTFVLDSLDKIRSTVLRPDTLGDQVYGRRLVRGCLERLNRVIALGLGDATAGLERSLTGTIKVRSICTRVVISVD